MGHKVHPKSFRIKDISSWSSRWLTRKDTPRYLEEDFKIREFLKKKLKESAVSEVEIERSLGKTTVVINSARPGLIIGRQGSGVDELRKKILKDIILQKGDTEKKELKIEIREIKNPWISAPIVGQFITSQIEKRMPFRKVMKQSLEKVMQNKEVKGARVEFSGRLDGSEIARREWLRKGQLPRQTLRADIDYAEATARCTYGAIGVKVWIYKGQKFE